MTSPRSSISSSDGRGYLRVLGGALGVLVAALVATTSTGYHLGLVEAANHDIYVFQRAKVYDGKPVDVAFVGDSSLGNAIDAATFTTLSGLAAANLALNGSYGSGGAFNMTYKLLDAKAPKLIVVTQSIDTMRRRDAFPGFYFSAEPSQLLTTSPIRILELYFSWKTARRVVEQISKHGLQPRHETFAGDYIAQTRAPLGARAVQELADNPLEPDMVAGAQLDYLARIAALCKQRGVACLYAHGPIYEGYCTQALDYIERLNTQIAEAGLQVVSGTPICLPESEVGDSIDHIRSDLKKAYTQRYFDLLRDAVGGASPASLAAAKRGGAP
jgi:hypothetical protein